jgi:predicted alpha/beta hydrolase family esterase
VSGPFEEKAITMSLTYTPVEFTRNGDIADPEQLRKAIEAAGRSTDLLLFAHGWNNDIPHAAGLIRKLGDNIETLLPHRLDAGRSLELVGLLWPSQQWGSDAADTPGGGLAGRNGADDLKATIAGFEDQPAARRLEDTVDGLDKDPAAREAFLGLIRGLLPPPGEVNDDDAMPESLRTAAAADVFQAVDEAGDDVAAQIVLPLPAEGEQIDPAAIGGDQVVAAGFGDFFRNPFQRARQLLNLVTFYQMKDRAGKVGGNGVKQLLEAVNAAHGDTRLHLAGHSFGARVVSKAAAVTSTPISSVSLLQGAYSHRGLAAAAGKFGDGAFRAMLTGNRLDGPVIITYTHNDLAVTLAYALASRLARQTGAGLGDAGDPYGGLGANGAVQTAEAVPGVLGDEQETYTFKPGSVYNLRADQHVSNHSDVTNLSVANAVLTAIASGR